MKVVVVYCIHNNISTVVYMYVCCLTQLRKLSSVLTFQTASHQLTSKVAPKKAEQLSTVTLHCCNDALSLSKNHDHSLNLSGAQ